MIKKQLLAFFFFFPVLVTFSQEFTVQKTEPPFWWTGFKNHNLQVMMYGSNLSNYVPSLNYTGVKLIKINRTDNPNYLFLDLVIAETAKPGKIEIVFTLGQKKAGTLNYELKSRNKGSSEREGFNSSDVIYLITPDRFSNGDTTNDNVAGYLEKCDRSNPDGRHGGDIKGILNHLDYLKDLGATAVWINPLQENNMAKYSYHGYSITDYYKTDPRFGSNEDYFALSKAMHSKGLKLIMDMVFNHCGSSHWWMKDLPAKDWINKWPEFTRSSYRSSTVTDPLRSKYDSLHFLDGWFDVTMPDMNQHNPFLARYLIQNSIWWIESAGLDGIRQDTYPYCFKDFMSEWDKEVLAEYPNFNIVGECWSAYPDGIAYWQKDALNPDHFNTYLPSVFDFAMNDALKSAFNETDEWNTGILRLYETLSRDFNYPDPTHIVVFADSHDANRFLATQNQDVRKLKMAMAFVLTTRGIPLVYEGTEMLQTTQKDKDGDGYKRKDFPGGWLNDSVNGFTGKNMSSAQADMMQYVKKIMNWRKGKEVMHTGKLKQFVPADGVYTYFRYNDKECVMVVMNNNETEKKPESVRYAEFLHGYKSADEITTGKSFTDLSDLMIPPKTVMIFELTK